MIVDWELGEELGGREGVTTRRHEETLGVIVMFIMLMIAMMYIHMYTCVKTPN